MRAWKWIEGNWRTITTVGCTVVAVGAIPLSPLASAGIGAVCAAIAAAGDKAARDKAAADAKALADKLRPMFDAVEREIGKSK